MKYDNNSNNNDDSNDNSNNKDYNDTPTDMKKVEL